MEILLNLMSNFKVFAIGQEGAKLEEARKTVAQAEEHESISKQLAKATGMKRSKVDKILCKERESQERIIRSYRSLVVSIATGYQGKGLSLKDLIQVTTHFSL